MTPEQRRRLVRRLAPLLLLLGVLIAYQLISPKLPHDHDVVFELGSLADRLVRLEVSFSDPERPAEGPALSSTWNFKPGLAPRRLSTTVRLHGGTWDVDASLEFAPPSQPEQISRRITLREGTTIIRLQGMRSERDLTEGSRFPAHD